MSLHYRGVEYEPTQPDVVIAEGEVIGRYRGAVVRRHVAKHVPVQPQSEGLKYRGATVH
ncbi:MAG: DUF4278 domain-containing protein [Leptolyngbya sp. SIO4C5]|nr:DUF4278 domain-containing protein [Leptolyngbya sp. SIO4C5]